MAQTETYANTLAAIQALAGETFGTAELARIKSLVNLRARLAYDQCDYWPSFLRVNEPRRVRRSFDNYGQNVSEDVQDSTIYDVDPRAWTAISAGKNTATSFESNQDYLLLEEYDFGKDAGFSDIDILMRAFAQDPFRSNSVQELSFSLSGDKALLVGSGNSYAKMNIPASFDTVVVVGGTISVTFTEGQVHGFRQGDYYYVPPGLTENTSTGFVPDGPYIVTSGVSMSGLLQITTSAAESGIATSVLATYSAANWYLQAPCVFITYKRALETYGDDSGETSAIPREFYHYIVRGVYADFLRSDGQTEKAAAEDMNAQSVLDIELEKVEKKNNHPELITRYRSHGADQSRY